MADPDLKFIAKRADSTPLSIPLTDDEVRAKNERFYEILRSRNVRRVMAPMVEQSELAFRMLLRRWGADLCYTPMIHAELFVANPTYRKDNLQLHPEDRPLVVQFCANDPETFTRAARLVDGECDCVDLNLGCPQSVAKRGHYGAFLQEEPDLIVEMVRSAVRRTRVPIACKIRVLDYENPQSTIDFARRLVEAGAAVIAVHGRTRDMKGIDTGLADWRLIRPIVEALKPTPVFANGNVEMPGDLERCLLSTGCAAVMSAEGILSNPRLFLDEVDDFPLSASTALTYLQDAERFAAWPSAIRAHLFRIAHHSWLQHLDLRNRLSMAGPISEFHDIVQLLLERQTVESAKEDEQRKLAESKVLWKSIRDRPAAENEERRELYLQAAAVNATAPSWICRPRFRPVPESEASSSSAERIEIDQKVTPVHEEKAKKKAVYRELAEKHGLSISQVRKRERRQISLERRLDVNRKKFPPCGRCSQPAGATCKAILCRGCCRFTGKHNPSHICKAHHANWRPAEKAT